MKYTHCCFHIFNVVCFPIGFGPSRIFMVVTKTKELLTVLRSSVEFSIIFHVVQGHFESCIFKCINKTNEILTALLSYVQFIYFPTSVRLGSDLESEIAILKPLKYWQCCFHLFTFKHVPCGVGSLRILCAPLTAEPPHSWATFTMKIWLSRTS